MKITKQLFGTLLAATALLSAAPSVKITLDKADQIYKCGEPATYTIEFTDDAAEPLAKTATYKLTNDNLTVIKTGTIDIAQSPKTTFKETMEKPSFLNLTVYCSYTDKDGKKQNLKNICTAGFEPTKIQPAAPRPADFMEYWKGELQKAEKECPLDPQMTKLDKFSNKQRDCYKVSFAAPGGRVYGFLTIPTKAKTSKMPALVDVPGAGPGHGAPSPDVNFVTLYMNVHPYDPYIEGKTVKESYAELNKPGIYMFHGGKDREATFFHRAIIGIARSIEWLANRPEVDSARIGYFGSSQGGAFGFIQAGLTGRFAAVVCNVPAMCDHFGADAGRCAGWPQYRNTFQIKNADGTTTFDKVTDGWIGYYDAVNFASYIKSPIRVIVGFIDKTCSPSSVYAAFNSIPSTDKAIVNELDMGHACRKSYSEAQAWMKGIITK